MRRSCGPTGVHLPGVRLQGHPSVRHDDLHGKSTHYPDVEPWFISTTGFCFPNTYPKATQKALQCMRMVYKHHLQRTPMGFSPPTEGRGHSWIARMRGLGREEEELEDTVSHLSIYLTGLDQLYREQAAQLKYQIRWAEKTIQEMKEQRIKAIRAENSLATLQTHWQNHEAHRGEGGWKKNPKKPIGIRVLRPKMRCWSSVFHQRSALSRSRKSPLSTPKLEPLS